MIVGKKRESTSFRSKNSISNAKLQSLVLIPLFVAHLRPPDALAGGKLFVGRGPEGAQVTALAIDPVNPMNVHLGTAYSGLFRSTDGGLHWSRAGTGIASLVVDSLAINPMDPAVLYAAAGAGIYKSVNGGVTWGRLGTLDPTALGAVSAVVLEPQQPGTIYLGTDNGIRKSTDSGLTWSYFAASYAKISRIVVDPLTPTTIYANGPAYSPLQKSTDGGRTWSLNHALQGKGCETLTGLAVDPQHPRTVYAACVNRAFRSDDGAENWSEMTELSASVASIASLVVDPRNADTVYAACQSLRSSGIMKSTDRGVHWSDLSTSLSGDTGVTLVGLDPINPTRIYAGTYSRGVLLSSDTGATWSASNSGLTGAIVDALAVDPTSPSTLYAGTYPGGLFTSTDGGMTWRANTNGLPAARITAVTMTPTSARTLLVGTFGQGIFKSADGGGTWTKLKNLAYGDIRSMAIDPQNPSIIYAVSTGVQKTTDGGQTWKRPNPNGDSAISLLAPDPRTPTTVYGGTESYGMRKSLDGCTTWTDISVGLPKSTHIESLAIDPQARTVYAGTMSHGVYKSTDGGANWTAVSQGLPLTGATVGEVAAIAGVVALAIDPQNPTTVYAGTPLGLYVSSDSGGRWRLVDNGLPPAYVKTIALDPSNPRTVYAGTLGMGVFANSQDPVVKVTLTLPAAGAVSTSTVGPTDELAAGYASASVDTGSTPWGTAVFSYTQNGVVVSEAGVPASPPTRAARFFVDTRSNVSAGPGSGTVTVLTGFAAVNPNALAANLKLALLDDSGATRAEGAIRLGPSEHVAKFLDQLAPDFVLPAGFINNGSGSLQVTSDQPVSILALRLTINQRGDLLLTSTPTADLTKPALTVPVSFPQVADGGGYQTTLVLLNTSGATETGSVRFYGNNGYPLSLRLVGGTSSDSRFAYSIPPGGLVRLQTDGSPPTTNVGWAQLSPDTGQQTPTSAAIFSFMQSGVLVTEAGVPATLPTTRARVYVDKTNGHDTGIAVANPGGSAIQIAAKGYHLDGAVPVGYDVSSLKLPPAGHEARFVGQILSYLPLDFTGVLDLSSTSPFSALTLRSLTNGRGDFLVTTFPVADASQSPPTPVVFPQIADGAGYQTQIILLSTSGTGSRVNVTYLGNNGSPMAVGRTPN